MIIEKNDIYLINKLTRCILISYYPIIILILIILNMYSEKLFYESLDNVKSMINNDKTFFVDKYSPFNTSLTFKCEIFDKKTYEYIDTIKKCNDFPHLLIHGPPGSGKKVLAKYILEQLYGPKCNILVNKEHDIIKKEKDLDNDDNESSRSKKSTVLIKESPYHLEIDMNINSKYDKFLTHKLLINYASINPLHDSPFRIVLIYGGENISYYSQTALRATIEKYSLKVRFIILTKDSTKIFSPIKSRLHGVKIIPPSNNQLSKFIEKVSLNEGIKLDKKTLNDILFYSSRNIKIALWMLQTSSYINKNSRNLCLSYHKIINTIVDLFFSNEELNNYCEIEELFYTIMTTNINESRIIEDIMKKIIYSDNIDEKIKRNVIDLTAETEKKLQRSARRIIQLNEYTIKMFMIISKKNEKSINI